MTYGALVTIESKRLTGMAPGVSSDVVCLSLLDSEGVSLKAISRTYSGGVFRLSLTITRIGRPFEAKTAGTLLEVSFLVVRHSRATVLTNL